MKIYSLFFCCCLSFFGLHYAQAQRTCHTLENMHYLESQNPLISEELERYAKSTEAWQMQNQNTKSIGVITIPVVVHVVYNSAVENISDAQILSQIDVLNKDFRRLNADASNTPAAFSGLASDTEIEFCLASKDPNGNATSGIVRKSTNVNTFNTNNSVKFSNSGGSTAWDVRNYFNIWVCDLGPSTLGYAEFPTGNVSNTYGVVISYTAFGTTGTAQAPFNKGRTATHEIGHCFNLKHIWGDATCGNDLVNDTPTQRGPNYNCPNFPKVTSCGNGPYGEMFMNYMDYTNDACMNMFTSGQKSRMLAVLNTSPWNSLKNSTACGGSTNPNPLPTCVNSNEPNESFSSSKMVSTGVNISGQIATSLDKDYLKFTIPTLGNLSISLNTLPADFDLKLYNAAGTQIGISQNAGTNAELISKTNLPAGTYTVFIYGYAGASNSTSCYTLNINHSSINNNKLMNNNDISQDEALPLRSILVYPNPASDQLKVDVLSNQPSIGVVKIVDFTGKTHKITQTNIQKGETNLAFSVEELSPGIYVLLLELNDQILTHKLVIE